MQPYIFLDPDGTQNFGVLVIVAADTGVTYAHQCAGTATQVREIEGFAVPVGGPSAATRLIDFFHRKSDERPSFCSLGWSGDMDIGAVLGDHVRELQQIVGDIAFWKTGPDIGSGVDERTFLELDMARLGELAEAWVPVSTAYGPAVLVFPNCD